MKKAKMAKRLTFSYFSVFSIALICIHYSVFYTTFEGIEQSISQKRLTEAKSKAQQLLSGGIAKKVKINENIFAYSDPNLLPKSAHFQSHISVIDEAYEIHPAQQKEKEFFVMQTNLLIEGKKTKIWMLDYKDVYSVNKLDMLRSQSFLLAISLALLIISLFVIQKLSSLLTEPLYKLASELTSRAPSNLAPVEVPSGIVTHELESLVSSINKYQQQIQGLVERERAFNDYVSHELRTPLTVIKGAISLLKQSPNQTFADKQINRLSQASDEMVEYVTTLLDLTRVQAENDIELFTPKQQDIEDIVSSYQYLLAGNAVTWTVTIKENISLRLPASIFKVMLGNLIKNAFAYTDKGTINITLSNKVIRIVDSGIGLKEDANNLQSYGLGLLIVKDICKKYGMHLKLFDNPDKGCTAEILLPNRPEL